MTKKQMSCGLTEGKTILGVSSPPYPAFTWYVPTSRTMAFVSSASNTTKPSRSATLNLMRPSSTRIIYRNRIIRHTSADKLPWHWTKLLELLIKTKSILDQAENIDLLSFSSRIKLDNASNAFSSRQKPLITCHEVPSSQLVEIKLLLSLISASAIKFNV